MKRRYQQAAMRLARADRQLRRPTTTPPPPYYEAALLDCEAALHDLARHGLSPECPARLPAERLAELLSPAPGTTTAASPSAAQLTPAEHGELKRTVATLAQWADERYGGGQS